MKQIKLCGNETLTVWISNIGNITIEPNQIIECENDDEANMLLNFKYLSDNKQIYFEEV
jgi:hypothetical protein